MLLLLPSFGPGQVSGIKLETCEYWKTRRTINFTCKVANRICGEMLIAHCRQRRDLRLVDTWYGMFSLENAYEEELKEKRRAIKVSATTSSAIYYCLLV